MLVPARTYIDTTFQTVIEFNAHGLYQRIYRVNSMRKKFFPIVFSHVCSRSKKKTQQMDKMGKNANAK